MLGAHESDELHRVGFAIVCGLLDASEVAVVKDAAASDQPTRLRPQRRERDQIDDRDRPEHERRSDPEARRSR